MESTIDIMPIAASSNPPLPNFDVMFSYYLSIIKMKCMGYLGRKKQGIYFRGFRINKRDT